MDLEIASKIMEYPLSLAPRGSTIDEYKSNSGKVIKISDPYRSLEDMNSDSTK